MTLRLFICLPWLGQIASEIDGRAVPTGEIDFLILHPKLGILAIEVKGGALKYERHQFVVLRSGRMIDPITQVLLALIGWDKRTRLSTYSQSVRAPMLRIPSDCADFRFLPCSNSNCAPIEKREEAKDDTE
jgi:hypothetical protein